MYWKFVLSTGILLCALGYFVHWDLASCIGILFHEQLICATDGTLCSFAVLLPMNNFLKSKEKKTKC